MRRDGLFWGGALILIGGLILLDNLGLLPPGINVWAIFWPLVLVAVGLRILLNSVGGPGWTVSQGAVRTGEARSGEAVRLPLQDARRAVVRFHHGAGELRVDANAAPDELLSGTFVGGLEQRTSGGPDEVTVDLRVPSQSISPTGFEQRLNWMVGLNPNVLLVLDLESGGSRNLLNLRDLQVKELHLQTGASETEIDFPVHAGETRATIRSGAASVTMRVPENVSARIHTHGGLASFSVDTARFPMINGSSSDYCSPDYEVAANKVDLDIETGVGSVTVR